MSRELSRGQLWRPYWCRASTHHKATFLPVIVPALVPEPNEHVIASPPTQEDKNDDNQDDGEGESKEH